MQYIALAEGFNKRKLIPSTEDVYKYTDSIDKDWYTSLYYYNEEQYNKFKETNSLAGIQEVHTNKLLWDFDSPTDVQKSQDDAKTLCKRLHANGVPYRALNIAFSGQKGFHVEVQVNNILTVEEFKNITKELSKGLITRDSAIVDAARIIRVLGTKHQKSKLYKFPLSLEQLNNLSIDKIKELAKDMGNARYEEPISIDLPTNIQSMKDSIKEDSNITIAEDVDFKLKPRGFSNCKFAIMQGMFPPGNRSNSLMALAATCRGLNYPQEICYNICKASIRLQATRYKQEAFDKDELWNKIILQVYKPTWTGGTYTCKQKGWLQDFCESLGHNKCKQTSEDTTVTTDEVFNLFENYAENYDKNVLNTGIKSLDEKTNFLVGTSIGVLAPPGVGKSSWAFNVLHHNSLKNINSIFFSYDMFHAAVYLRLIQRQTGYSQNKIFDIFKHDKKQSSLIKEELNKEFSNVKFCFKAGQSPIDIEETITETEDRLGSKIKLAIFDYNELITSQFSDSTAASAEVAQRMRQIANEKEICVVQLLQPSKLFSNPSDEARTYQAAKGSGAVSQALSLMLSLSRPGFDPRSPENDRFLTINALKNRNGSLFSIDLRWDGLKGSIYELQEGDEEDLISIREKKEIEKQKDSSW